MNKQIVVPDAIRVKAEQHKNNSVLRMHEFVYPDVIKYHISDDN